MPMVKKNTEQLVLDFVDRFNPINGLNIGYDKRQIDETHILLWFKVTAEIYNENSESVVVAGESYTLDKALTELTKNAMFHKKPDTSIRRIHIENHPYDGMENIVQYKSSKQSSQTSHEGSK